MNEFPAALVYEYFFNISSNETNGEHDCVNAVLTLFSVAQHEQRPGSTRRLLIDKKFYLLLLLTVKKMFCSAKEEQNQ